MLNKVLFLFCISTAALCGRDAVSLMRIDVSGLTAEDWMELRRMNIDIAAVNQKNGSIDALITPQLELWLADHGLVGDPLIPDVNTYAEELRQSGYFEHFRSYQQMVFEMFHIVSEHPQTAAMYDIGDTFLKSAGRTGYDIWALKISDDVTKEDSTEEEVLYMAGIHAREIITPEILFYFIHYLLDNNGRDPFITHLVQNRELWFIPCANPDGHEYVFQGDPGKRNHYSMLEPLWWRKNMRDNNMTDYFEPSNDGVDLNRNFGFAWGIDDIGSSPFEGNEVYRGTAPFSEPETQTIRDFTKSREFIISLSYHSYGNLWLYPWGYTSDPVPLGDAAIFKALADSCVAKNGYVAQTGAELYLVNGDTDDWFYGECGIFAFTPEVGDAYIDGFHPDTSRILPLIEENLHPNLYVAWVAGEEPIIEYEKLPDTLAQQPFVNLKVMIKNPLFLTDSVALDTSSFRVFYRPENEHLYSIAPVIAVDSSDYCLAKIPADKLHGKVYYYAEAADKLGRRGTRPIGAPMALDSFFVEYSTRAVQHLQRAHSFDLVQNYPNPFNASTTIHFWTERFSSFELNVYDLKGRKVRRLTNGDFGAGEHRLVWDGKNDEGIDAPSGFYICRLSGNGQQAMIKTLLLR